MGKLKTHGGGYLFTLKTLSLLPLVDMGISFLLCILRTNESDLIKFCIDFDIN